MRLSFILLAGCCVLKACCFAQSHPQGQESAPRPLLSWNRDGGFAGFCDELKVSASGDFTASSCRGGAVKTGKLPKEQLSRLEHWKSTFGPVSIETKDSPAADAMTIRLTLNGSGSGKPGDAQREEMLRWAETIYTANHP